MSLLWLVLCLIWTEQVGLEERMYDQVGFEVKNVPGLKSDRQREL